MENDRQGLRMAQWPRARRKRIVTIGGGHGQATSLAALASMDVDLTAIVSVADEGGCSGILRSELGMPPPGDARRCLAALARDRRRASVFERRGRAGTALDGRSVGNLMLARLGARTGDLQVACDAAGRWLEARGRVVPAALSPITLLAQNAAGEQLVGELEIATSQSRVVRVTAAPGARPILLAARAVHEADIVVLGPGSFHTSVLAALSAPLVAGALTTTRARIVWLANLTSEGPQTERMALPCYVHALREHVARESGAALRQLTVVAHGQRFTESAIDRETALRRAPLASAGGLRHDPIALATALAPVLGVASTTAPTRRLRRAA